MQLGRSWYRSHCCRQGQPGLRCALQLSGKGLHILCELKENRGAGSKCGCTLGSSHGQPATGLGCLLRHERAEQLQAVGTARSPLDHAWHGADSKTAMCRGVRTYASASAPAAARTQPASAPKQTSPAEQPHVPAVAVSAAQEPAVPAFAAAAASAPVADPQEVPTYKAASQTPAAPVEAIAKPAPVAFWDAVAAQHATPAISAVPELPAQVMAAQTVTADPVPAAVAEVPVVAAEEVQFKQATRGTAVKASAEVS